MFLNLFNKVMFSLFAIWDLKKNNESNVTHIYV